jgi:3-oxoacyl-[acyl-carrier-protein] synthase-3
MGKSFLVGVGSYLPERIVTNHELAQSLETSDSWIRERTGIGQRHVAAPGELTSDLATKACQEALKAAGISLSQVDLLIVATSTPDNTFPATATRVQANLGMTRGMAFDMSAACSGFVFALATADMYLSQGLAQTALVVGAETFSRIMDWEDRTTAILFGDGAGAVVLMATSDTDKRGLLGHVLHTDGRGYDSLYVSGGPSSSPLVGTIQMNGREVYKNAVQRLGQAVDEILEKTQTSSEAIDWLVPHQANLRIIDSVLERLSLSREKAILTIDRHANTSAASIPLALDWGIREGHIQPGQLLLLEAFAAGFAWGANLIRL